MSKYRKDLIKTAVVFFCAGVILHFANSPSASYWLFAASAIFMISGVVSNIKEYKNKK